MLFRRNQIELFVFLIALVTSGIAWAAEVTGHAQLTVANSRKAPTYSGVVMWLTPADPQSDPEPAKPSHFRLVQKDKMFVPHLLVVPLYSTVDFPNLDPFFHNVFSQFNGKRFDLGLYEAGSTKTVRFDHEGVSYIFCNIHPEMTAVVIALATPYVAVSGADGSVTFHNVPDGNYDLHVWAEGAEAKQLEGLSRHVHVHNSQTDIGLIQITKSGDILAHKNKYGEDYRPSETSIY